MGDACDPDADNDDILNDPVNIINSLFQVLNLSWVCFTG